MWLVRGLCSDLYCGCGGGHVLGIATSQWRADQLAIEAKEKPRTTQLNQPIELGKYEVSVKGPIMTGDLIETAFQDLKPTPCCYSRPHDQRAAQHPQQRGVAELEIRECCVVVRHERERIVSLFHEPKHT